ncbi:MAG: FKBP-type peptidyl-prolyl cis-trans isomerase [Planctomycetota bacterium]
MIATGRQQTATLYLLRRDVVWCLLATAFVGCGPGPAPLEITAAPEPLAPVESGSAVFRQKRPESRVAVKTRTGAEVRGLFEEHEFTTTDSGLRYAVLDPGGDEHPGPNDTVVTHYVGVLESGAVFDSSVGKRPPKFSLGGVIAGWTEGLQLIGAGGRVLLICPPDLAYGDTPQSSIPPNSTLYFDVEILAIR